MLIFEDGSALRSPGPTGAGAVLYVDGYKSPPVRIKKSVIPMGNNYNGVLVGIQSKKTALERLTMNDKYQTIF